MEPEVMEMSTDLRDPELRDRAVASLRKKHDFWSHLVVFVVVNAMLIVIWAMSGSGFFWPVFPIVFWGIGVFFHGWDAYAGPPSEARIRNEMDRLDDR
jgi:uncharacterized membrane protein YwaF